MHNFVHEMLHDSPAALRIMTLWNVRYTPLASCLSKRYWMTRLQEYEAQETKEARFVKGTICLMMSPAWQILTKRIS